MQRNPTIDNLRAIATISMILIHTSYYFISDKFVWWIWNWSQFAVPVFIFCSGFVFFLKPKSWNYGSFMAYEKKRLIRLLLPYYVFICFFISLLLIIQPQKVTLPYIWQSILVIGGIDISWLVLLMIQLGLVLPLVSFLYSRYKTWFFGFVFISLLFSFIQIIIPWSGNYKWIMWLPWSLVGVLSIFFLSRKPQQYLSVGFISAVMGILVYVMELLLHHDTSLINNKYPPTLLILSYGIACISLLYWLSEKRLFARLERVFYFISNNSYSIYFIHYCFLIFFASYFRVLHLQWYTFFSLVFFLTIAVQYMFNLAKKKYLLYR